MVGNSIATSLPQLGAERDDLLGGVDGWRYSPAAAGLRGLGRWLRVAAGGDAVAVSRGPAVDGHQAVLEVPFDKQRRRDAQREHDRLLRRVCCPPRGSRGVAKSRGGRDGRPVQLEFALAVVWAGHDAVQHIPRVAEQVVGLLRPCHGTHKHVAVHEMRLDRADAGRSIRAQRAQHRNPRGGQPGHSRPGNLGRAPFQVAPARRAG